MRVVLLHALPLDPRMWEPQLAPLEEHNVVTPRLYDLGSSMDEWAEQVLRRVDGRFALVGASMGGYAALAIAQRAPERVQGLVLSGSRADADPAERREARENALRIVADLGAAALWEEMQRGPFAGTPAEARRRLTPVAEAQRPEGLTNAIMAIRDRADLSAVVATYPGPFLIVVGDSDPLISPDEARQLAATAADGRAEIFEGVGHLPSYEQPERFNALLRTFLDGIS